MQAGLALQAGRQPKANPRFVVTNVKGGARRIYQRVYCQRGEVENRIKELKAGVEMDRASCTSFYANQFRVLLSAAAYALLQELRWRARETRFARTQVEGLRLSLLKLGVWVRSTTRRVVLSLPREAPYVSEDCQESRCRLRGAGSGLTATGGEHRGGSVPNGEGHPVAGASQPRFRTDHATGCRPSRPVRCRDARRDRKTGPKTV